jgi:hypothetical protein
MSSHLSLLALLKTNPVSLLLSVLLLPPSLPSAALNFAELLLLSGRSSSAFLIKKEVLGT